MKRVERREEILVMKQRNTGFMLIMNELNKSMSIAKAKKTEPHLIVNKIKDGAPNLFSKINKLYDLDEITHIQLWDDYYLRKDGVIILTEDCEADSDHILSLEDIGDMKKNQIFKID